MAEKPEAEEMAARFTAMPGGLVRVSVPADVAYDLEKFQGMFASLMRRLGCLACCSGRPVLFQLESDFSVDPETLEVRSVSEVAR